MENFKFEAFVTDDSQIKRLEDCLRRTPGIQDWRINERTNGILLNIMTSNAQAYDILLFLQKEGFMLERLYEE